MKDPLINELLDIEKIARETRKELRKSNCNIISVANAVEALSVPVLRARTMARRRRDHALEREGMVAS